MHVVIIIIGLVVGGAVGASNEFLFGAVAGGLIASLMYQLGNATAKTRILTRRLEALEKRQEVVPAKEETEPAIARKTATPERVSIYEPEEPPPQPVESPTPEASPEPIVKVHERTPVKPREPSTIEHLFDVAKRWLVT